MRFRSCDDPDHLDHHHLVARQKGDIIKRTIRTRRLRQASDCRKQLQIYALDDFSGRWGVLIDLAYPPPELFVVYAFPRYMIDEIEQ